MSGRDMTLRGPYLRNPTWMGDVGHPEALLPAGLILDPAQFVTPDTVSLVVNGAHAAGLTVLTVDALVAPPGYSSGTLIPDGTVIHFGGAKFAKVNDASILPGDTTITVLALPTALVDNDVGSYVGLLRKSLPSGTIVGRTLTERDANTPYGPAVSTDDEIFILAFDVEDMRIVPEGVAYRPKHVVYENFLPDWSNAAIVPTALKTAIRALYFCQVAEA